MATWRDKVVFTEGDHMTQRAWCRVHMSREHASQRVWCLVHFEKDHMTQRTWCRVHMIKDVCWAVALRPRGKSILCNLSLRHSRTKFWYENWFFVTHLLDVAESNYWWKMCRTNRALDGGGKLIPCNLSRDIAEYQQEGRCVRLDEEGIWFFGTRL